MAQSKRTIPNGTILLWRYRFIDYDLFPNDHPGYTTPGDYTRSPRLTRLLWP